MWDVIDVCRYDCMHMIVAEAVAVGGEVHQYHGKWPFVRFLGVQEPASVAFSLLNLAVYLMFGVPLLRHIPRKHYMLQPLRLYVAVGCNAWLWSTVFHTRDTAITEKLDYFSATAWSVTGLFVALVRYFEMRSAAAQLRTLMLVLLPLAGHIYYLGFVHFDYGYNMFVNVLIGVIHGSIWFLWHGQSRRPHGIKAVLTVMAIGCGMALELFDFPPIAWTFDAHSLWHLWTVPCGIAWFSFWRDDIDYDISVQRR